MIVTYLGHQFFKIQHGDLTIAVNPPSKTSKFKSSKFGADIVLASIRHEDFNGGAEDMSYGERKPFVIQGPGEYEVKGVFIKGLQGHSGYDMVDWINTIYTMTIDNMRICFLGAQDDKSLSAETKEGLKEIDVLFVPIGGEGVLEATPAYKLAVSLEARIIIPMHFDPKNDFTLLQTFLKEGGSKGGAPDMIEKLTIKRKDLDGKEGEIVVLSPQLS